MRYMTAIVKKWLHLLFLGDVQFSCSPKHVPVSMVGEGNILSTGLSTKARRAVRNIPQFPRAAEIW